MTLRIFGVRPGLWPTLITVPAVLLAFGLGIWQVQRLFWKEGVIAERQSRSSQPALDGLPDRFDPKTMAFRPVRVTGRFVHDKELYRPARSLDRGAFGAQVFTPFKLSNGEGYIFVNRGWVPDTRMMPDARRQGQVIGEVTVEGLLREPPESSRFAPDNEPDKNRWYSVDLKAMAEATGLGPFRDFYVDAGTAPNPGGYPIGGQTRLTARNAHLQYAITWFALGLTGIVIYLLYHRRRARSEKDKA